MGKDRQQHISHDQLAKVFNQTPPSAIPAEMATLGSMIVAGGGDIHIIAEVMEILPGPEAFEKPAHQALYRVLVDLYDRNASLDAVQITQELQDRQLLDRVGGQDYVIQLAESVPIPDNAPYYAKLVASVARRRDFIGVCGRGLTDAYTSDEDIDAVIDACEANMFELRRDASTKTSATLIETVQELYRDLEKRHEEGRTWTGLDTGFHDLNDLLSGFQPKDMIVLAARPSMGKTQVALNIAEHVAINNRNPVAIFSLEMDKKQLAGRLMAQRSGVDSQRIRRNMLTADEFEKLQRVVNDSYDAPLYLDDSSSLTISQLRGKARRLASQHDIKLIILDYLQLMTSPGKNKNRQEEVGEISKGIKSLARELGIPIIALSQLNRNPEGRSDNRPMLSDLRESGSIEQDADVVMLLHREAYYTKGDAEAELGDVATTMEIIVAKQRNGPCGTVYVKYDPASQRVVQGSDEVRIQMQEYRRNRNRRRASGQSEPPTHYRDPSGPSVRDDAEPVDARFF